MVKFKKKVSFELQSRGAQNTIVRLWGKIIFRWVRNACMQAKVLVSFKGEHPKKAEKKQENRIELRYGKISYFRFDTKKYRD